MNLNAGSFEAIEKNRNDIIESDKPRKETPREDLISVFNNMISEYNAQYGFTAKPEPRIHFEI